MAGRAKLDQEFRSRNDAIEMDELRGDALEQRLQQGDMSPKTACRWKGICANCSRNVNRRKEDLRDELSFRRTEEVQNSKDRSISPCRKLPSATALT